MELYRYRDVQYADGLLVIHLETYETIKETPCGYWVLPESAVGYIGLLYRKKWVSKTSRKRFAYPTKAEALNSLKARRERQIVYAKSSLNHAQKVLAQIECMEVT